MALDVGAIVFVDTVVVITAIILAIVIISSRLRCSLLLSLSCFRSLLLSLEVLVLLLLMLLLLHLVLSLLSTLLSSSSSLLLLLLFVLYAIGQSHLLEALGPGASKDLIPLSHGEAVTSRGDPAALCRMILDGWVCVSFYGAVSYQSCDRSHLHSRKLTWNPRGGPLKRPAIYRASLFRLHSSFPKYTGAQFRKLPYPSHTTPTSPVSPRVSLRDVDTTICYFFSISSLEVFLYRLTTRDLKII